MTTSGPWQQTLMSWQVSRLGLLILLTGGVAAVFLKVLVFPTRSQPPGYQPLSLPQQRELAGWEGQEVSFAAPEQGDRLPTQSVYTYTQGNLDLTVTVESLVGKDTIEEALDNAGGDDTMSYQVQPYGFYRWHLDAGVGQVQACIDAQSRSAATYANVVTHSYRQSLRPEALWRWLLGQAKLRDWRCQWTTLQTPVGDRSPQATRTLLETAWIDWVSAAAGP